MIRRYVGLGATCGARPGDVCWTCCVTRLSLAAPWRRMLGESREKPRGVLFIIQGCNLEAWRGGAGAALGVPGLGLLGGPSARRVQTTVSG